MKEFTLPDLFSEIKSNSLNSLERDFWPTQEELSSITEPHQECSGELLEVWFHTRLQEEPLLCVQHNHNSERLKVFEGVPAPYDTKKRQVIPDALKCVKLTSFRKFCNLGDLSHEVGWGKKTLIEKFEEKRR